MNKKQFLLCKKIFGPINHHQLLNGYILHNFFALLSNIINCQEQLKTTIQQTEKKKKCTSFLGVCIMSSNANSQEGSAFFFFSVRCIVVFNCSWQLMIFDKKQKSCVYSFSNWWWFLRPKSFLHSKNCFFIHPLWMMRNLSII